MEFWHAAFLAGIATFAIPVIIHLIFRMRKRRLVFSSLRFLQQSLLKESRRLRVRIQEKFAFPAICLVFGLIGSSLGVRPHSRTSNSQGFGISVLLIFGYYLMSFIFSSLGITAALTPFLAAWLPVLIGLAGGVQLLRQASR